MKHLLPTTSELVDAFNDLLAQHDWQIRHVDVARLVAQHDLKALPFMFADMFVLVRPTLDKATNKCVSISCVEMHKFVSQFDMQQWQQTLNSFKQLKLHNTTMMYNNKVKVKQNFATLLQRTLYARQQEAVPFVFKPFYPTRTSNSTRKDKSDVQTCECFAFANMLDDSGCWSHKAQLIVDDATVDRPQLIGDVVCCSLNEAQRHVEVFGKDPYINKSTLFCVCSVFDNTSPLYEQHKQFIESWTGNLVWLWWDLRLAPKLDGWKLKCRTHLVMTQAQNKQAVLDKLNAVIGSYEGKRHEMFCNAHLHALPAWYPNFSSVDSFNKIDEQDDLTTTFSCPMVRWQDMGPLRQGIIKQLLSIDNISVNTCGNLTGMPQQLVEKCSHHGTVKCSDIVAWNKQFDFALMVPEQFMIDCNSFMFRSTEAMLANVIAVFVGNAPLPQDDLLKVQDLSELQNLYNMTDKQKEQLLHAQQSCLSNLKSSMLKDMQIVFDYQLQYAHCI